jgi:hypothetical protein
MLTEGERLTLVDALRRGKAARRGEEPTEAEVAALLAWAERARAGVGPDPAPRRLARQRVDAAMLGGILDGTVEVDLGVDGEPVFAL